MNELEREQLAKNFNAWLAERFNPYRTRSGETATKGGVIDYGEMANEALRLYLGCVFPSHAIINLRGGKPVIYSLRARVVEIVELSDQELYSLRVDQAIAKDVGFLVRQFEKFGPGERPLHEQIATAIDRAHKRFRPIIETQRKKVVANG